MLFPLCHAIWYLWDSFWTEWAIEAPLEASCANSSAWFGFDLARGDPVA